MTEPSTPAETAFANIYRALSELIRATPGLMGFAGWPEASFVEKPAHPLPAARILANWAEGHSAVTEDLHQAARGIADFADWQHNYSEADVGADFLSRYAYTELVGPQGHFRSDTVRAYLAYWGENLAYGWHLHEAEELYFILSGRALFKAEGMADAVLGPGDIRIHRSNQPHAMTTTESPILALVLWRGAGLSGRARMGIR